MKEEQPIRTVDWGNYLSKLTIYTSSNLFTYLSTVESLLKDTSEIRNLPNQDT